MVKTCIEKLLNEKNKDGFRTAVPVIGNGINLVGQKKEDIWKFTWKNLIKEVMEEEGIISDDIISLAEKSPTFAWEALLLSKVEKDTSKGNVSNQEEDSAKYVQTKISNYFNKMDNEECEISYHKKVIDANFMDIMTTNFDSLLHDDNTKSEDGVTKKDWKHNLSRHFVSKDTEKRVWHLHGDAQKKDTICLGIDAYSSLIRQMQNCFNGLKKYERKHKNDQLDFRSSKKPLNWVDIFMTAPLVFIGFGFNQSEWALWWALNKRARNLARVSGNKPKTFWITNEEEVNKSGCFHASNIYKQFENLGGEIIKCPGGYEDMWDCFVGALK